MKVLKFGGTSVGTVESLKEVKKIVEAIPGKAVVVVSALGGLTDLLISTAGKAAADDSSWKVDFEGIRNRHFNIIKTLVEESKQRDLISRVEVLLAQLERNYKGVNLLGALPQPTLDVIVSFGERISSEIVSNIIEGGKRHDSLKFVKTEKWYGKNIAERGLTESLIRQEFANMGDNEKAIVPGFISTDSQTSEITNLGRGGSDFTAALIAAALDAEVLEIWTDVDGFMTADPRIVKDAIVIDHLTFTESMELCSFGAKVIYPPTIYPVFHKNIPIKILNTFNSSFPGSLITDEHRPQDLKIKGVSALKSLAVLEMEINPETDLKEIANRSITILLKDGIPVTPLKSRMSNRIEFAVAGNEAVKAIRLIEKEMAPELSHGEISSIATRPDYAAVAIVGKEINKDKSFREKVRLSLLQENLAPEAEATGTSDTSIVFLIKEDKAAATLSLIHKLIYS